MTQTKRTTKFPIEEIYTEADRSGSHDGRYTFYAPMSWAGDITLDKAVAVRRAKVFPPAMIIPFGIRFSVQYANDGSGGYLNCVHDYCSTLIITETTTLYDILNKIGEDLQTSFDNNNYSIKIAPVYEYDNKTHKLSLGFISSSINELPSSPTAPIVRNTDFRFFVKSYNDSYGTTADDAYPTNENTQIAPNSTIYMLQTLFNQTFISDTLFSSKSNLLVLDNVWDRENLEIHASFSNSKNRFIAVNGDFFQSRNMIFNARNGFNAFDVWFSTDGTNRINLADDIHFILQLTFINQIEISIAKDY